MYSVSAITAAIYSGNDQTNTILQNSAIALRYRIVCVKKVKGTFSENGNSMKTLLDQLTSPDDGYMDEAQTYRNTYRADFVGLVVSNAAAELDGSCAVAWINAIFNDFYSYAAYCSRCVSYGSVYGHEIGHTMGCQHDRITALQSDPSFIAYGNCWEDASKTDCTCYSSIMVYQCNTTQNQCTDCITKPFMANPNVIDSGNPTGLPNAACGLHIHNNRFTPITYRKSIQPGGMLFSVLPTAAVHTTCYSVNITGWQLLRDLNDVPTVTISGVPATVISFDINSVQVKSPVVSAPSHAGNVVVTATQSGRVTTLPNAFTFLPPQLVYNESFSSGTIMGTRWSNVDVQPWIVESAGVLKTDGSSAPDGASAVLQYTVSSASPQTGSCSEVVSSLSFSYWAYSSYSFCYIPFTVQVQTFGSSTWTIINSSQGQSGSGPYISVSVSIPSNVQRIILKSQTQSYTNCRYFTTVKVMALTVKSTYSCSADIACSNVPAPSVNPTVSPTVVRTIKGPTLAPKIPFSGLIAAPTHRPSESTLVPINCLTAAPTKHLSTGPTAAHTKRPTIAASTIPTERPTAAPSGHLSTGPTAAPRQRPTLGASITPTERRTVAPTTGPIVAPTIRLSTGPTAAPRQRPTLGASMTPTERRTVVPTTGPTIAPPQRPTTGPTVAHTMRLATDLTASPRQRPTSDLTAVPTKRLPTCPTAAPM